MKQNKNMWLQFRKCIFCCQDLAEEKTGVGEHVIPANIFGFWCSYDVCGNCMKYFGSSNVDKLAIMNPLILESMEKLNVAGVDKKYEQMPFLGEDDHSPKKVPMIRRAGKYKAKVTKLENNYFECSEDDLESVAIPFIRAEFRDLIPTEELNKEIEFIKKEYLQSKPGESTRSKLLGITLRKNQISKVIYDTEKIPTITPLIAKIVFIAIHYFVKPDILLSFRNYGEFRNHARFGKAIKEFTINHCHLRKGDQRFPFHMVRFISGSHILYVDCTFFGYNNWRSILYSDKEDILFDGDNKRVEEISFYMEFKEKNRKKFVQYLYPDGKKLMIPVEI